MYGIVFVIQNKYSGFPLIIVIIREAISLMFVDSSSFY